MTKDFKSLSDYDNKPFVTNVLDSIVSPSPLAC